MAGGVYVKIRDLPQYHKTIVAAIAKYPNKRAKALSKVLLTDYGLAVKWGTLYDYAIRHNLWSSANPTTVPAMPSETTAAIATDTI